MDTLKTGDLIGFKGTAWVSKMIECCTRSSWSHVGIIWRDPPNLTPGVYLLECSCTPVFGVQLSPFREYAATYSGEVWVFSLTGVAPEQFSPLPTLYQQAKQTPYDIFPPDIIRTLSRKWCSWRARQTQDFVCSTFACYVYEKCGLVNPRDDWTVVQPADLLDGSDYVEWISGSFAEGRILTLL